MAIELQSAKFFPGFFEEEATVPTAGVANQELVQQNSDSIASAYAAPAPTSVPTPQIRFGVWTTMMTVVASLCGFMGVVGILGGLGELMSVSSLPAALEAINQAPQSADTQITKTVLETQIQMQVFLFICVGFRILLSFGFLAACSKMFKRSTAANEFVATICIGTIFYYLTTTALAWMSIPSFEGLGLDAQATQFAGGAVMVMMVFGFLFNSAIFGAIIAYMYNENNRNYFAPKQC